MTGIKVWVVKMRNGVLHFVASDERPKGFYLDGDYRAGFEDDERPRITLEPPRVGIPEQFILPQAKRVKRK